MRPTAVRPDHMDVGTGFIVLAVLGGLAAALLSLSLRLPAASTASWRAVALQHGSLVIFFSAIPALLGGFGNWFAPLQVGAGGTAFPRLALLSLCLTAVGLVLMLGGLLGGAPGLLLLALHASGVAILLCSANLVATLLNMREPGMSLAAMPLFAWSQLVASCLAVCAVPMLLAAVTALAARGVPPALPLQHVVRMLGYPGACMVILPGAGLVSEILCSLGNRALVGRPLVIAAMAALATAGFVAWADPLLRGGLAGQAGAGLPMLAVLLPALAMTACWTLTLRSAPRRRAMLWRAPGLFALGFVLVLLGGSVARPWAHGTGQPHDILSLAAVFAMFAGFYYWIGKMTGKAYPDGPARLQFCFLLGGIALMAAPAPTLAAAGAAMTGLSVLLFALILAMTMSSRMRPAAGNPWGSGAVTAEWRLPSPVPHRETIP